MSKNRPFARILVVDDERQIRRSLKVHLETKNYTVKTASSGEKALETLARWKPDLVVLDLLLPSKDGIAIIRQIRE
jgi:DNA-binding response OmpR family regulator